MKLYQKKVISVFLAGVLLAGMTPVTVFASDDGVENLQEIVEHSSLPHEEQQPIVSASAGEEREEASIYDITESEEAGNAVF